MKILVLGGDGYLGWPTAMHLSAAGHEVLAVDNYLRRRLVQERGLQALYDVPGLEARCKRWKTISGKSIFWKIGDLMKWDFVEELFGEFTPDAIVHYAEQPSAPYSMIDRRGAALT